MGKGLFVTASEVAEELGVSEPFAYMLVKKIVEEPDNMHRSSNIQN